MEILFKKHKIHLRRLFCSSHICYCVNMVSVTPASRYITSASRYHPRFQSRSSMYIRGLIPWNFAELAEAVLIEFNVYTYVGISAKPLAYANPCAIHTVFMEPGQYCFP